MIARKPRPFIFIHIPGTGGNSIEEALLPAACGAPGLEAVPLEVRVDHALPVTGLTLHHEKLTWFENRVALQGYLVFAVVRNPFGRAISQIHYLRTRSQRGADLCRYRTWADNFKVLAGATETIWGHDIGACQVDYLTSAAGALACKEILRFEQLERDWSKLLPKLGIDRSLRLPRAGIDERLQPHREFYTDDAAELIAKKYRADLETFQYQF
jgi:hypothetical protein